MKKPNPAPSETASGLLLVGCGGLVLSFDIPLIRLSVSDLWTVLLMRGLLTGIAVVLVWYADRRFNGRKVPLVAGPKGLGVVAIFSIGAASFIFAVFHTSAGNVVFILAFNSMFAAILSWFLLGEVPSRATLVAIPATILGVVMIVGAGFESGNWLGDLAALFTAAMSSLGLTLSRRSRQDMRYAAALGVIPPAVFSIAFVAGAGFQSAHPGWLVLNGFVVIPIALMCLASAPRFVPSPMVALGYLIETALAPVWIWMVFGDRPVDLALAGGAVIVVTLLAHSLVEYRNGRARKPVGGPRILAPASRSPID